MAKIGSKTSSNIAIYAIGSISRQLVGFIMLPVYTRYLTPEDYGVVALLTISIAVFELVFGARFAQAIPRFYYEQTEEKERKIVISTALSVTAAFSLTGLIVIWYSSPALSALLFGSEDYSVYLAVFAILLFTSGIEYYGLMYLRILEKPIHFVSISLVKLTLQLSLNIYLIVFLEYGVMGVVISSVISSSVFCVYFMVMIYGRCGFVIDATLIKKLFLYTWPLWIGGAISLYTNSSNKYYIRLFSSLGDVGLYELASKFAMIQIILIWEPFSNWWQTERFKLLKQSEHYQTDFQRVFDMLITFLATISIGIIIFSGLIIRIMSSSDFHEAIFAVTPLTLSILFFSLSMFFNFSFLASDKTIYITYLKLISAITITILFLILIPEFGFIGASFAALLSNIILFYLTYIWGKKYLDLGIRLRYFLKILVLVFLFILVDHLISYDISLLYLTLIKCLVMLVFVFTILIALVKNKPTSNSTVEFLIKGKSLLNNHRL